MEIHLFSDIHRLDTGYPSYHSFRKCGGGPSQDEVTKQTSVNSKRGMGTTLIIRGTKISDKQTHIDEARNRIGDRQTQYINEARSKIGDEQTREYRRGTNTNAHI